MTRFVVGCNDFNEGILRQGVERACPVKGGRPKLGKKLDNGKPPRVPKSR
jgi:hypothetical protein